MAHDFIIQTTVQLSLGDIVAAVALALAAYITVMIVRAISYL